MKKDSDYEIALIAKFSCFYTVVACFYYLAYFAGSHSWFSNQHDLCFIVKDMQETGWVKSRG